MTRSAGEPGARRPAVGQAHEGGGGGGDALDPALDRVVELGDADGLAEDLEHVEVAVGVERVAGVVAGEGERDAAGPDLLGDRDAAPARGAAGWRPWR